MAIVNGFARVQAEEDKLFLAPTLPENWQGYHFRIRYHGSLLEISINKETCSVEQLDGTAITVVLYEKEYMLETSNGKVEVPYQED